MGWTITKIRRTRINKQSGIIENTEITSALVVFRKVSDTWQIEAVSETYK